MENAKRAAFSAFKKIVENAYFFKKSVDKVWVL